MNRLLSVLLVSLFFAFLAPTVFSLGYNTFDVNSGSPDVNFTVADEGSQVVFTIYDNSSAEAFIWYEAGGQYIGSGPIDTSILSVDGLTRAEILRFASGYVGIMVLAPLAAGGNTVLFAVQCTTTDGPPPTISCNPGFTLNYPTAGADWVSDFDLAAYPGFVTRYFSLYDFSGGNYTVLFNDFLAGSGDFDNPNTWDPGQNPQAHVEQVSASYLNAIGSLDSDDIFSTNIHAEVVFEEGGTCHHHRYLDQLTIPWPEKSSWSCSQDNGKAVGMVTQGMKNPYQETYYGASAVFYYDGSVWKVYHSLDGDQTQYSTKNLGGDNFSPAACALADPSTVTNQANEFVCAYSDPSNNIEGIRGLLTLYGVYPDSTTLYAPGETVTTGIHFPRVIYWPDKTHMAIHTVFDDAATERARTIELVPGVSVTIPTDPALKCSLVGSDQDGSRTCDGHAYSDVTPTLGYGGFNVKVERLTNANPYVNLYVPGGVSSADFSSTSFSIADDEISVSGHPAYLGGKDFVFTMTPGQTLWSDLTDTSPPYHCSSSSDPSFTTCNDGSSATWTQYISGGTGTILQISGSNGGVEDPAIPEFPYYGVIVAVVVVLASTFFFLRRKK
jgi:hypothetical protein